MSKRTRHLTFSALVLLGIGGGAFATLAPVAYVVLQPASPGFVQAGHVNVSGTVLGSRIGAGTSSPLGKVGVVSIDSTPGVHIQSVRTSIFAKSTGNSVNVSAGYFSAAGTSAKTIYAEATATSGTNFAGYFKSKSPNSFTLFADNYADGPPNVAIKGRTHNQGVGVWGEAPVGGIGTIGEGTIGVQGSGTSKGVHGIAVNGNGYAVYAEGDFAATGTKNFIIDHPQNPENQYLVHYCSEGPEPRNDYFGSTTLDARGTAAVTLPSYFASINRDPLVLLTPHGAPMPGLYVVETTESGFTIAGGAPGGKVTWMVSAVRHDRWVRKTGIQTERPKPQEYRGTYLQPELYGKSTDRSELAVHSALNRATYARP